ncbi:MAG: response regulator transcription factor, partial [Spirochaetales bacterium]|nr:response regulator transcription factor [Spirochaetales bacterium]
TASNGKEAIEKIDPNALDLVLLDIRMPEMDGIEVTRRLKEMHPRLKVLILTTFNERKLIAQTIRAGASGYLLKDASESDIVASIKSIHQGNILISPSAAQTLAQDEAYERNEPKEGADVVYHLSHREQEVFFLLVHGRNNSEMATELYLSERTIRNYASKIYNVLGVNNRHGAIAWAQQHGFI